LELFDSHCHLDLEEFGEDRSATIQRALDFGVRHMVTIGIDYQTSVQAIALAEAYDCISATVGHHPHDAHLIKDNDLDRLRDLARHPEVVGFGEIGLDFFRNLSSPSVQRRRFDDLLQIGLESGLPIIIHDRDAHEEIIDHLAAAKAGRHRGVIHCFSGDYDLARRFVDLGFLISIPGTVTFPKAEVVRDVVRRLPLDVLLIETDAPFLAPVPHRGKRNEPAFVRYTAAAVALARGEDLEKVACATSDNACDIFRLGKRA
jgi:TatD DNase family protein